MPSGAKCAVFASTGDSFAKFGDTRVVAALPAADVTDGSGSELNPEACEVSDGVGFVSLIAAAATTITVSWFSQ